MEYYANEDMIGLMTAINTAMDSRTKPLPVKIEQLQAKNNMQDYIGLANMALCFVDLKPEHKLHKSIRRDLKEYFAKAKGGEK